jgi:hypothetical protein
MQFARGVTVVAVLLLACGLSACGQSDRDQVRAKVFQFARAAAAKDYKTICEQVLAPTLLARLAGNGVKCERAMQLGLRRARNVTLSVGKITVSGKRASALTLSGAQGEQLAIRSIGLEKTESGWRILSLSSPLAHPPSQ